MSLEKFNRLADSLVAFEVLLNGKQIPLTSSYVVAVHKDELKAKWESTKIAYEELMQDRAAEQNEVEGKAKSSSKQKSMSIFEEEASEEETFTAKCNSTYLSYCNSLAVLGELQDSLRTSTSSTPVQRNLSSGFQLPACDTSIFHGDYYSWPSFRDSFIATFIRSHLSPVQKLLQLRQRTKS